MSGRRPGPPSDYGVRGHDALSGQGDTHQPPGKALGSGDAVPGGCFLLAAKGGILAGRGGKVHEPVPFPRRRHHRGQSRRYRQGPGHAGRAGRRGWLQAAQDALDEASRLLAQRVRQAEDTLRAFEEKVCEGVTAFLLQNPVPEGAQLTAAALWQGMRECDATRALVLYMETSLGHQDREYLIWRTCSKVRRITRNPHNHNCDKTAKRMPWN